MNENITQKILRLAPKKLVKNGVLGFETLRSLTFLYQNLSLPLFEFLVTGKNRLDKEFPKNLKLILEEVRQLLQKDAENIANGIYPIEVLKTESPKSFFLRYPQIILDGVQIARRRLTQGTHDFNREAAEYFREVPDYFKRNYHFQTGGYLTEKSAELYEHQVEILFSGAADAMRRLLLPLMKEHFPYSDGEGLHFLEVAAGTGRLTRFVKLTFPKAKITVMDVSHPYLKKAQKNLSEFTRMNYVQGSAEELPFQDEQFDAVYSCFLFHEVPIEVRRKIVTEGYRVLKPSGFYGFVDSIQNEDKKSFEWALKQFPVDFHEPFYKNYLQNPMEGILSHRGFINIKSDFGFLAKAVGGQKPT